MDTKVAKGCQYQQLALPAQLQAVPPQVVGPSGASLGLVELVALAQSSARLARSSQTSQLPVLLHSRAHPVDFRVPGDCRVVDVNHYHLIVLVGRVLANPVGVEDAQPLKPPSHPFLSNGLQVPLRLLLVHRSRGLWLTIGAARP